MQESPAVLGDLIDSLHAARSATKAASDRVMLCQQIEKSIEDKIIAQFGKLDIEGAIGYEATATLDKKDHFSIEDRPAFNQFVKDNDAYDLYQNRLSSTAIKARKAEGVVIPGLRVFRTIEVKTRTLKR